MKPIDSDDRLPVTAEVGSEGGSYADPTIQIATFSGEADEGVGRTDAVSRETLEWAGLDDNESATALLRYPTEPPAAAEERGRVLSGHPWRKGLVGVAAGTAAIIGAARLRRRA